LPVHDPIGFGAIDGRFLRVRADAAPWRATAARETAPSALDTGVVAALCLPLDGALIDHALHHERDPRVHVVADFVLAVALPELNPVRLEHVERIEQRSRIASESREFGNDDRVEFAPSGTVAQELVEFFFLMSRRAVFGGPAVPVHDLAMLLCG